MRDAPDEQVLRLLALQCFPAARVEPLAPDAVTPPRPLAPIDWSSFRRLRSAGPGSRGADAAFGFRLHFDQPVTGPIALGYAAHQGARPVRGRREIGSDRWLNAYVVSCQGVHP
jgi:hypothetical protein